MAFQRIIDEILILRFNAAAAAAPAAASASGAGLAPGDQGVAPGLTTASAPGLAHVPIRTPLGYPNALDDLIVRINELQSQLDTVKSRCHCEHVDAHEVQIQAFRLANTHEVTAPGAPAAIPTCSPCNGTWDP